MKCPHCLAELNRYECRRSHCVRCQKPFALDPSKNALRISDPRLLSLANRLSRQGTYRYTSAQLAHFAIWLKLEPARKRGINYLSEPSVLESSLIGGFIGLIAFGFALLLSQGGHFILATVAAFIVGGVVGFLHYASSQETSLYWKLRKEELGSFETKYIIPWVSVHGPLPGLVTNQEIDALRQVQLPPSRVRAVLASPVADVLDCLRANELPERLGLALLSTDGPYSEADERILALLRQRPRLPLLLIHDAGVAGCLLPALLPGKWGLSPNHRVIDLGLRPRHVKQQHLPWKHERASKELTDLFKRQAKAPGGLTLEKDEIKWLREGLVTTALHIPPARLVNVVTRAVERLTSAPVAAAPRAPVRAVDPEAQAQAEARHRVYDLAPTSFGAGYAAT